MRQLGALLRKDARIIYRDRFLLFLPAYALLLAAAGRVGVPAIPVADLGLYLAPAMVVIGTALLGTVLGFALIEETEQATSLLLKVLPVERQWLYLYLGAMSSFLSFWLGLVTAVVYGYPVADLGAFLLMTAVASISAPIIMLVLAVFASNKIEGLAVAKIFNLVSMAPAAAFFLPMPWQMAVAWSPWYWIYLGLLKAYESNPDELSGLYWPGLPLWLIASASVVTTLGSVVVLARLYGRRQA